MSYTEGWHHRVPIWLSSFLPFLVERVLECSEVPPVSASFFTLSRDQDARILVNKMVANSCSKLVGRGFLVAVWSFRVDGE